MERLFVTGGSGFIGRGLLAHLPSTGTDVTVLTRDVDALAAGVPPRDGWHYLVGDVRDPTTYASALGPTTTVVHLASTTGKARPREYHDTIVAGTGALLEACRSHDVGHVVFVSSIAARFDDVRFYPYASAKREAERLVSSNDVPWTIVRPTMVFGPGSAVQRGLATLAGAPVGLMPGRGMVRVQPVHRDDVARVILDLAQGAEEGGTVEVGGPDRLSFMDLMRRLRMRLRGRDGPWLRLPVNAMRRTLAALEPALLPILPLTAGQLASFANDSTAAPHPFVTARETSFRSLDAMLEDGPA